MIRRVIGNNGRYKVMIIIEILSEHSLTLHSLTVVWTTNLATLPQPRQKRHLSGHIVIQVHEMNLLKVVLEITLIKFNEII